MNTRHLKKILHPLGRVYKEYHFPYSPFMRRHGCIFIHIPKTAGTSMLLALGDSGKGRKHLPWHVYKSSNAEKFNRYFKFAFVRNPWDRAFSAYNYIRSGGNKVSDNEVCKALLEYNGFNDFVINGLGSGRFRSHLQFLPQSYFIAGPVGEIMVDYLGHVENYREDFCLICGRLGIDTDKCETRENARNDTEMPVLTASGVDVLYNLYRQDIDLFRYTFQESRITLKYE